MPTIRVDPPGTTYPMPPDQWDARAHAPDVLELSLQSGTLWDLMRTDEGAARGEFAAMARAMADLGAGSTVINGGGQREQRPLRPIAYLDAIAMGEEPSLRNFFLFAQALGAESSCGMFIRNLYKLIGVQDPSYKVPYVGGQVIAKEHDIATSVGALRSPGDKDARGRLLLPMQGDCVYATKDDDSSDQHFFVVVGYEDFNRGYPVKLQRGPDSDLWVDGILPTVAQGGQMSTDEFPDDGGDRATNIGHPTIIIQDKVPGSGDQKDWVDGDKKVRWWINLHDLVMARCKTSDADGDHGAPWVMPLRNARY